MRTPRLATPIILLIPLLLAASCENPLDPFEPEINSAQDNFQLQATGVSDVTSSLSWSWANSGTRASVDHSTTTSAGSARLIIRDPTGAIVYDHVLEPSRNEPTSPGAPGTWTIQLQLVDYSGTLNFRAQKL